MFDDCIIMAGGSGTRLWPVSNTSRPKQFLSVSEGHTFFDAALERALAVIDHAHGRVIIIAGENHVTHIIEAAKKVNDEERKRLTLIVEPEAKNTAVAIACGVVYAERTSGGNRNMVVLTSDHLITPLEVFKADLAAVCGQQEALAVLGIPPRSPETGYGYIEASQVLSLPPESHVGNYTPRLFKVASFREKPDKQTAEQFIAQGNFYWNSGMFAFSSRFIMAEFKRSAPQIAALFGGLAIPEKSDYTIRDGLSVLAMWPGLKAVYSQAERISFDYAIVEKCAQTIMVAAGFDWLDVGSWDEYARLRGDTGSEVYYSGGRSCFVDSDIPVAICGAEDLIVVVRSGKAGAVPAVLIAKKGATQQVSEIVKQIKDTGKRELL